MDGSNDKKHFVAGLLIKLELKALSTLKLLIGNKKIFIIVLAFHNMLFSTNGVVNLNNVPIGNKFLVNFYFILNR